MRSLKGVWCAPCAAKGHSCQAQTFEDGLPLCLRCRDGEACIWETAQASMPAKVEYGSPCIIATCNAERADRLVRELVLKVVNRQLRGEGYTKYQEIYQVIKKTRRRKVEAEKA